MDNVNAHIAEGSLPFVSQGSGSEDRETALRFIRLETQNRLLINALESLNRENSRLLREYEKLERLLAEITAKPR